MRVYRSLIALLLIICPVLSAVLGIDYGQEFTKAVLVAPGAPFEIVLTADSKRKDSSGILFKQEVGGSSPDSIERYYGNAAGGFVSRFPAQSPFYFKSILGSPLDDSLQAVRDYKDRNPGLSLVPSFNNRSTIAFQILNSTYAVEELLAMSLSNIRDRATTLLKGSGGKDYVRDLAISVPSYFTLPQRLALKDATDIAGLRLIALVNDGVAVAVNYAASRQFSEEKQYHVVFDVGAGSTTATLVSISQDALVTTVSVEGYGYDEQLGGQLLTQRVRDLLIEKVVDQHSGITKHLLENDHKAMARLWKEAERVKFILSANNEVTSSIESIHSDFDFRSIVTREEFETVNQDLVDRVVAPLLEALNTPLDSNRTLPFQISDLNSVILSGGSSRVPFIQQKLLSIVGEGLVSKNVNADEAAVLGTTLRGVGISGMYKSRPLHVIDRSIFDYSIETTDGGSISLFPRGTPAGSTAVVALNITQSAPPQDYSFFLSENGVRRQMYNVSKVAAGIESLDLNDTIGCGNGVVVEAEFELDESRIVVLDRVVARCVADPNAIPITAESTKETPSSSSTTSISSSSGSSSQSSESSTASTTSAVKHIKKALRKTLTTKVKFLGPRPMGTASKKTSSSRLRSLDQQDNERLAKENARNELEGFIYRFKDFLASDDLDTYENSDADITFAKDKVAEYSEWLDYESQSASFKEVSEKLLTLKSLKAELDGTAKLESIRLESVRSKQAASSASKASVRAEASRLKAEASAKETSTASASQAAEDPSSTAPLENDILAKYNEFYNLMKDLGIDPEDDKNVDIKNFKNYIDGELEPDVLEDGSLEESLKQLKDILGNVEKLKIDDESLKEKLAKLPDFSERQKANKNNEEKYLNAIKKLASEAAASSKIADMLKRQKTASGGKSASHDEL